MARHPPTRPAQGALPQAVPPDGDLQLGSPAPHPSAEAFRLTPPAPPTSSPAPLKRSLRAAGRHERSGRDATTRPRRRARTTHASDRLRPLTWTPASRAAPPHPPRPSRRSCFAGVSGRGLRALRLESTRLGAPLPSPRGSGVGPLPLPLSWAQPPARPGRPAGSLAKEGDAGEGYPYPGKEGRRVEWFSGPGEPLHVGGREDAPHRAVDVA